MTNLTDRATQKSEAKLEQKSWFTEQPKQMWPRTEGREGREGRKIKAKCDHDTGDQGDHENPGQWHRAVRAIDGEGS